MTQKRKPIEQPYLEPEELKVASAGSGNSGKRPRGNGSGTGGGGGGELKAGQRVECTVVSREPGGYVVRIPLHNAEGFLPTREVLDLGDDFSGYFVCFHRNRALLAAYDLPTPEETRKNRFRPWN